MDVWTQILKTNAPKADGEESSLIFVGKKGSGKTTCINTLMMKAKAEPAAAPKPTQALDYAWLLKPAGVKSGQEVAHVWEIGGGSRLASLIEVPLTKEKLGSTTVVVCADLSRPATVITSVLKWIGIIRDRVQACAAELAKEKGSGAVARLTEAAWRKYGAEHPDKAFCNPCPVSLMIVATKLDLFESADVQHQRLVARTLRFIAHYHCATLLYFSQTNKTLNKRLKEVLAHYAFGDPMPREIQFEHTKPLIVPAGCDTRATIGDPPDVGRYTGARLPTSGAPPIDAWVTACATVFPDGGDDMSDGDVEAGPDADLFREPTVDAMRAEKDLELERYRRDAEKRFLASSAPAAAPT